MCTIVRIYGIIYLLKIVLLYILGEMMEDSIKIMSINEGDR